MAIIYFNSCLKNKTTLAYLHMTSKSLMGVKSPLDSKGDRKV